MCYYAEGKSVKSVSPEVFVVRGVSKHLRCIYKFVEEVVRGRRVMNDELGLELVNDGKTLRLYDPPTKQFLRGAGESAGRQTPRTRP